MIGLARCHECSLEFLLDVVSDRLRVDAIVSCHRGVGLGGGEVHLDSFGDLVGGEAPRSELYSLLAQQVRDGGAAQAIGLCELAEGGAGCVAPGEFVGVWLLATVAPALPLPCATGWLWGQWIKRRQADDQGFQVLDECVCACED